MGALISHQREKLVEAVLYFAQYTRYLGKTKLYKLLYFLDFEHFKLTGRAVTGLDYFAWKMGPVPVNLHEEIDSPEPDLLEAVKFEERLLSGGRKMIAVKPLRDFNARFFSKRELSLMFSLAGQYAQSDAEELIEATHLDNRPWHRVYEQENGKQRQIPFEYALNAQEVGEMNSLIEERKAVIKHFA